MPPVYFKAGEEYPEERARKPEITACLRRSLVRTGPGRELVCPAVWCELDHVAILMYGLPAFVEFAT
jgi:hypothetical protein